VPVRRALAVAVILTALWAPGCLGQSADLTTDPALTRGPATAPVTIVEFSDYQ